MIPKLFRGGVAADERGVVSFVNDFDFTGVKRFFQVSNHASRFIRAWHGHRREGVYVHVSRGAALVGAVCLERQEVVHRGVLSDRVPSVLWIPPNHANGFMNLQADTTVQFFSTATLAETAEDDIRFQFDRWNIWTIENR